MVHLNVPRGPWSRGSGGIDYLFLTNSTKIKHENENIDPGPCASSRSSKPANGFCHENQEWHTGATDSNNNDESWLHRRAHFSY